MYVSTVSMACSAPVRQKGCRRGNISGFEASIQILSTDQVQLTNLIIVVQRSRHGWCPRIQQKPLFEFQDSESLINNRFAICALVDQRVRLWMHFTTARANKMHSSLGSYVNEDLAIFSSWNILSHIPTVICADRNWILTFQWRIRWRLFFVLYINKALYSLAKTWGAIDGNFVRDFAPPHKPVAQW